MKPRIVLMGHGLPARLACLLTLAALCIAPLPSKAQEAAGQRMSMPLAPLAAAPFGAESFQSGGDPFSALSIFDPTPLMECLCRKALASTTCKPEENFNFVGETEPAQDRSQQRRSRARGADKPQTRVLTFSGFYGTGDTQFFCQDDGQRLILSSQAWPSRRITVPYTVDGDSQCVRATMHSPACGEPQEIDCCLEKR